MKRAPGILCGLFFIAVSVLQFRLIAASLTSLAAWCVLAATHPASLERYWNPGLLEYWCAGVTWITVAARAGRSALRMAKKVRTLLPAGTAGIERTGTWSRRVIFCIAFVALTSPFLAPIDPDAQGHLVTTRLRPPLSSGYVREYLASASAREEDTDGVRQVFSHASNYLTNRTMVVGGRRDAQGADPHHDDILLREFPAVFVFGTDDNARDVFSRVIAGARVSLGVGISAALGALIIGAAVGFLAGMSRGIGGGVLMGLTDLFLAIPSLFLVIGALAFVGQSILTIVLVLSLTGWMGIARVVRGEILALREREFILAAQMLRVPKWKIVWRHLVPNIRPVLVTATVLQFANAVLGEAALGFLGLGVQPPTATWGNMMGEGTSYLGSAWWVGVFPGILLAAVLVSAHSMGERSATTSDPRRPER